MTPDREPYRPSCKCGASWGGRSMAHCTACHVTFLGPGLFDRHRCDGACVDPVSLGMSPNSYGAWRVPPGEAKAAQLLTLRPVS